MKIILGYLLYAILAAAGLFILVLQGSPKWFVGGIAIGYLISSAIIFLELLRTKVVVRQFEEQKPYATKVVDESWFPWINNELERQYRRPSYEKLPW